MKVSRNDLLSELARPEKSAPFRDVAHRFYLATPPGLVRPDDPIPAEWGLLEATTSSCRKVRAGIRCGDPEPLPERALVEAFRRAARAEARIRGAHEAASDDPARIPHLVKQLASAQSAEERAKTARDRDRRRLREFLEAVAVAGGWVCVCGKPMKAPSAGIASYRLTHVDGSRCDDAGYSGFARPDLAGLAARLGIGEETSAFPHTLGGPSPLEELIRTRGRISAALADPDADPREALAALLAPIESALAFIDR